MKSPVWVPEKSRISKRKPMEEEDEEDWQMSEKGTFKDTGNPEEKGTPRWVDPTLEDVKKDFLEYMIWYNSWEPEFMYLGPRLTPTGISIFKIWGDDSDSIPDDLRVLNWNQIDYGYTDNYSFIPSPVPQYYPSLRPLRPVCLENVEKSGIPKSILKKNLRFYSPWYLIKKPYKPPSPPTPPPEEEGMQGELDDEEELENAMLRSENKPIKDSGWGDYTMKEQIEIIGHILHMMVTVPNLTLEYVFEQLEEFCAAVGFAESDENSSPSNVILRKKRTIILEQYFLAFFGKKFRDYNERTPIYMRTICSRLAYYIQNLYEYTAQILWELQSRQNPPTPIPTPPETPDDPESLQNWDDWLAWLMKVTNTCDEWAGWISDTVNEAEQKAAKKKYEYVGPDGKLQYLTAEEWYKWKASVEKKVVEFKKTKRQIMKESSYYNDVSGTILPVKHRRKNCKEEEYGEEEGEFDEEGKRYQGDEGEGVTIEVDWPQEKDLQNILGVETEDETEWEDVEGEF